MIYKLSNAAEMEQVEKEFGLKFKYPALYSPEIVINGLQEANLSILTMENACEIEFAIWGLLPENYKEDWLVFQRMANTLNVTLYDLETIDWMGDTLKKGRCLIVVTGFFTYLIRDGKTYPYHIGTASGKPFYLAGVYQELDDGFLSCSLVTTIADSFLKHFHDIGNAMPLIVPDSVVDVWLSEKTQVRTIENIIKNPPRVKLRANPIAKDFFKNDIIYDSILQPVFYEGIPQGGGFNH